MHVISSFRPTLVVFIVVVGAATLGVWEAARAQPISGQGMMLVADWPDEETKRTGGFEILPFIDTLGIAYRYQEVESRPDLSIVLEWTRGREAIYDGRRVSFGEIDGFPAMVGLELSADVVLGGSRVAEFSLIVDSMVVESSPDLIRIDLPDLGWDNIFMDTPGDVAREIFTAGFELQNPTIVGAAFALFEEGRLVADTAVKKREGKVGGRPPHVGPRRPRNVSIYRHPRQIGIGFDVFWLIGSGHRRIRLADDGPRDNIGRGSLGSADRSRSGRNRGAVDRSRGGSASTEIAERGEDQTVRGRRGDEEHVGARERDEGGDEARRGDGRSPTKVPGFGNGEDDDDKDDDDSELVPYAVAAVAAAGVLAVVGGTVGYYGNARYAPLGLTSGFVRNDGGLLLQVGVNEALIAGEGGPKRLMGRALSFGNLLGSPSIQPALGAGVLATSRGGDVAYEPSVSVGGVVRHDMILFYAGYDVVQNSPEFSLAVNLRRIGLWGKKRD